MKAIKTQIYPRLEQAILIDKTIGCARFVYNNALSIKKTLYEEEKKDISIYELIKQLPRQKKENEWLKEVDSQSLQQSLLDLDKAYKKFYREKRGFPNFHKKGIKDSYRTLNASYVSKHKIMLPKIGEIKTIEKMRKKWKIKSATISKRANKYFISILIDYIPPKAEQTGEIVGIDMGIKDFAILSNGKKYKNLKVLNKYQNKLSKIQRELSNCEKGSKNRNKKKIKLAKLHLKVANIRNDYLHKLSREITNQYSFIAVENLNIQGMVKNHKLAKSICDCSWGKFIRQLEYKTAWNKCVLYKIGKFEPSSKLCSNCGYKMEEMPLNVREWDCPNCNAHHDRDLNAASNILNKALVDYEEESVDTHNIGCVEQKNLE